MNINKEFNLNSIIILNEKSKNKIINLLKNFSIENFENLNKKEKFLFLNYYFENFNKYKNILEKIMDLRNNKIYNLSTDFQYFLFNKTFIIVYNNNLYHNLESFEEKEKISFIPIYLL